MKEQLKHLCCHVQFEEVVIVRWLELALAGEVAGEAGGQGQVTWVWTVLLRKVKRILMNL